MAGRVDRRRTAAMPEATPVEVSLWTTQTALMRAALVLGEPRLDRAGIDAVAPVARDDLGLQAELLRHPAPERREPAGLEHQDAVAGRERVDERRFPGAGARGRVDDDRLLAS